MLIVTGLIVYGSLYPWQFHPAIQPGNPFLLLLHSWAFEINRYFIKDTAINLVLYLPFGAACYLWLADRSNWVRLALPPILGFVLSSSLEMIQLFDASRNCSMLDVLTNFTGTIIGVAIGARLRLRLTGATQTAGPLFLFACWVGSYLFPFMPDLSTRHLLHKLSVFPIATFALVPFVTSIATWLVVAEVFEKAFGRARLPFLLFALPLRFLISGLTLGWTDVLSVSIGLAASLISPPRARGRVEILAALSVASILLTGLSPFHLSPTAQAFSWMPFRALFSTEWESGFAIFFRKCFAYGSSIWLLLAAGLSLTQSAVAISLLLATLEAAQLWLPNHVSESTDPLHALILALVLYRLGRNEKRTERVC